MPPWAAPVCERVGYSFVSTAVRVRSEDSRAGRTPAPPAPTMTTSYVRCAVPMAVSAALASRTGGVRRVGIHAQAEREDHEGGQHADAEGCEVEQPLQPETGAGALDALLDDGAEA